MTLDEELDEEFKRPRKDSTRGVFNEALKGSCCLERAMWSEAKREGLENYARTSTREARTSTVAEVVRMVLLEAV